MSIPSTYDRHPFKVIAINPMPDGTARTIKSQYQQTSFANMMREGAYAATGVIRIDDEINDSANR